jgi:hypothetical protein
MAAGCGPVPPGGRLMTSFEGDTTGPRDEAVSQLASAASGPVASAQDADLNYWESAENTVLAAGATDDRFSRRFLEASVRRVIAAWAKAVGGDEGALAAVARPEAVQALLHAADAGHRARLVVRGLRVTQISVMRLRTDNEPPQLGITFCYIGRRSIEGGDTARCSPVSATPRSSSLISGSSRSMARRRARKPRRSCFPSCARRSPSRSAKTSGGLLYPDSRCASCSTSHKRS